ncbi:MAG: peptidoglycan DD-metalloendopeptidase family protein [Oscillospiraceae bacterium]|jgi:murein DD-endopeptidase MepM/ murein hydrolase activator NlpD|nr:peptidoglycan DD-metalloendopeptidase family protein [Oscillospiraceae bacterium]
MKNNKNFARIVAVILAIMMLLSLLLVAFNATASAVTQSQIDKLKSKSKELNDQKRAIQSEINSLKYEQLSATAKKTVLDNRIALTEDEIDNINETIDLYYGLIEDKEAEVDEAQRRENAQLELYKRRVRDMEENGAVSYIAVVFDAASFSDLLARIDFVSDIMRSDEAAYNDLVRARLETVAARDALIQAVAEQEAERVTLQEKQAELELQVEESIALLEELQKDIDVENAMLQEKNAENDRLQKEIQQKMQELREQEEAAAKAGNASGTVKGTGTLQWPAVSNVVTSEFGTRRDPVGGKIIRQHTGIDIRASYGSNIYAADGGKVLTAMYSSSYGNYVVISHGAGMTTLYGHMSKLKVKVGDTVSKGTVIGAAGSTGNSTATHLHFEVAINGDRKNPLNYFDKSGYTIKG